MTEIIMSRHIAECKEIINRFNPDDDIGVIVATQELVDSRDDENEKEIKIARINQKRLMKALNAAEQAAARPANEPTATERVEMMTALDKERLSLIKSIRDSEAALSRAQEESRYLKEDTQRLEGTDVADEHNVDASVMKLEIIKQLGFEPLLDKNGQLCKLLIHTSSGEVHTINLMDNKLSEAALRARLWEIQAS